MTLDRFLTSRWLDVAVATLALVVGWVEYGFFVDYYTDSVFFVMLLMAVAAGLSRALPSVSLGTVWILALTHLLTGTPVLFTELAVIALVAFAVAFWGSPTTSTLAGVSIPVVLALALALYAFGIVSPYSTLNGGDIWRTGAFGQRGLFGAAVLSLTVLGLPYLAGLALRSQAAAQQSRQGQRVAESERVEAQVQAAQAQEIARLRDDQARLARDVHDVVGHSLAVILAQAESAQYLPDDADQLKATLATIATSARSSLQDVRQVLATTATSERAPAPPSGLESLVAGIRASGQEVVVDEVGTVRPLPPELEVVAHRVLQEMLTNAVKHGVRDRPIRVERHWPAGGLERDLRLEVSNGEPPTEETQPLAVGGGQGIDGMRRRLESVGGRIDVRRRVAGEGATFTATAWVPVSGR